MGQYASEMLESHPAATREIRGPDSHSARQIEEIPLWAQQTGGHAGCTTRLFPTQREMSSVSPLRFTRAAGIAACLVVACVLVSGLAVILMAQQAQQPQLRFGGEYSELDERRQQLINDWVTRFAKVTGQSVAAPAFYDDVLSLSTKTTFDAVTQALMTTPLTDASGETFSDGLALIERVDTVKGEVLGTSSDRQFRMYVRLTPDARQMLERSREFKRGMDNSVYHKGYPLNYREQGGAPSIQVSIALDGRQADVDVDYRSSSFPVMLFNGHLGASNSDVRAGNNAERHAARWSGFQNWWRSFFGVGLTHAPDAPDTVAALALPKVPRAGKKNIKTMVPDFLQAWLVEGNIVAAMGYVSERAYACLAEDEPDPSAFDRGLAPFQILVNLKAAHDALDKHDSLESLITAVRLPISGLREERQPHQAQFALYKIPNAIAARFDCASRLTPGSPTSSASLSGEHAASVFRIAGSRKDVSIALLWAKDDGYWKIVSWQTAPEPDDTPAPPVPTAPAVVRIKADLTLVHAAKSLLDTWLIRKDYDAAFRSLSTKSYGCYDLTRGPDAPASTSPEDAGKKIRASLERIGKWVGKTRQLDTIIESAEPLHSAIRVMDHPYSRTFTLSSFPTALGDAVECDARARGAVPPDPLPLQYGEAFGMTFRFRTQGGDAPVLRLLWRKEANAWRITAYDVEVPN